MHNDKGQSNWIRRSSTTTSFKKPAVFQASNISQTDSTASTPNVDLITKKLLEVRGLKPGQTVQILMEKIIWL